MSRRRRRPGRFDDRTTVGPSDLIPLIPGEGARRRHVRRLRENLSRADEVAAWCLELGIRFRCLNRGEHWEWFDGARRVEWWPRTAKLVLDKRWRDGVHVHDFEQAMAIVMQHFNLEYTDAESVS